MIMINPFVFFFLENNGKKKKEQAEQEEQAELSVIQPIVKRGRGRPRKQQIRGLKLQNLRVMVEKLTPSQIAEAREALAKKPQTRTRRRPTVATTSRIYSLRKRKPSSSYEEINVEGFLVC